MGDISEEGKCNYYNGWKRMTLINNAFPRWRIVERRHVPLFASDMKADFKNISGHLSIPLFVLKRIIG